jgi:hypothetical protein
VFVPRFVSDPVRPAAETGAAGGQHRTIFDADDLGAQPLLEIRPGSGLVLLGEAGTGKSEALARLVDHWVVEGLVAPRPVVVDLEIVTGDSSFATHVANALRTRLARRAGGQETLPVVCVLDNVDRCGLAPKALGGALAVLLAEAGEQHVCLVMACRTTQWPAESRPLACLQIEPDVRHLLQLWREQVAELARALKVDPDAFLREVDRVGAMPLACIPLTARMLVGEFAAATVLPADPVELFEAGLTKLAGEWDEDWVAAARAQGARVAPAALRMDMAAQIAAWALLCARASVLVSDARSDPADLRVTEVAAGPEASIGDRHDEIALLRDALDCAVFTSRGRYRRSVRHPSFAAYLAARYLANSDLNPDQLRDALVGPRDAGARVYPLLREVAAWLVARDPDRFEWLVQADAETIVSYPYALAREQLRARLVDAVLELAGRESLRSGAVTAFALDRLEHPGLEQQLRDAMAQGPAGRVRAAIEIARATRKVGLVGRIAAIAGDPAVDEWVRTRAVQAAAELDPETASDLLRRTLLGAGAEDLPDEVRGALLDVLWPDALGAAELVTSLTRPRSPLVFGLYALFLYRLPECLTDADMPDVLWSVARGRALPGAEQWRRRPSTDVASRLISRAWMATDRRPLLPALAALVRSLILDDWHTQWPARLDGTEADTRDRRTLLELMVHQADGMPEIDRLAFSPMSMRLGLLRAGDLGWMRERASTTTGDTSAHWQRLRLAEHSTHPRRSRPRIGRGSHRSVATEPSRPERYQHWRY